MSLEVTIDDIRDEVGRALGYGRNSSEDDVIACVKRGMRQFYTPEPLQGERVGHRWSFLRSIETLNTHAPTSAATVTIPSNDTDRVNITTGSLLTTDALSISHVSLVNSGTTTKHLVSTVADTTTLDLSEAAGFTGTGISCTVHYNGTYALPADFAGIEGPLTYDTFYGTDPNIADQTIEITSESKLRDMMQYLEDRDDKPRVAAVYSTGADGTTGTSHRIAFFPIPDATYVLKYKMINEPQYSLSGKPLGGPLHGETILASCLAVAEQFFLPNSPHGYVATYRRRLAASIELDRQAIRSETLGYNADPSEFGTITGFTDSRLSRYLHDNTVTVNGVQY
jgi:hypothetical protein